MLPPCKSCLKLIIFIIKKFLIVNEWINHMKNLDIGKNDIIVIYDEFNYLGATRAWL